jgi:eukaryotic-like serine/threonine-protein kinase
VIASQQHGKYVLGRKLAEGGMAELFLAKQQGLEGFEKLVVVKRILPQLSADDSFVAMFLNEARVAARLNHPNVVQIFDLGRLDSAYFIAMEYVHGEDLRTLIREAGDHKRPSLGLACRIIADTLAGLHYAHTRNGADGKPLGLVHRDVSPQNVIVTFEGTIKIVDFGIAKATRAVGAAQTQAGLLKGKYSYMSPEQARGVAVDARADVFCAGILLWELATWTRLFKRPTEMATLMAVVEETIPPPRAVAPTLPPELDAIIRKALARNPDERYASAQEMRAALEALIRKQAWEADSLALQSYMHELFAGKLSAQAADIAAAGLASLEDFLLAAEDKTSISWMEIPEGGDKRTPSSGLPMTPPFGSHILDEMPTPQTPTDVFDDGPTTKAPDELIAASRAITPGPPRSHASGLLVPATGPQPAVTAPVRPRSGPVKVVPESQLATVRAATSPHNETLSSPQPPPANSPKTPDATQPLHADATKQAAVPATADPEQITLRPHLPLAASPDAATIAPVLMDPAGTLPLDAGATLPTPLVSSPTATTAARALQPEPTRISSEVMGSAYGATRDTRRHDTWAPPSRWRRVLVAGSAAVAVGAIALTIALWPASDPAPPPVSPAAVPPNSPATLSIELDAPGDIAIDGKPQAHAQTATTVNVQPGIEHEVTVQSAGHPARRLHVPALAPGEHLPLKVSLK